MSYRISWWFCARLPPYRWAYRLFVVCVCVRTVWVSLWYAPETMTTCWTQYIHQYSYCLPICFFSSYSLSLSHPFVLRLWCNALWDLKCAALALALALAVCYWRQEQRRHPQHSASALSICPPPEQSHSKYWLAMIATNSMEFRRIFRKQRNTTRCSVIFNQLFVSYLVGCVRVCAYTGDTVSRAAHAVHRMNCCFVPIVSTIIIEFGTHNKLVAFSRTINPEPESNFERLYKQWAWHARHVHINKYYSW